MLVYHTNVETVGVIRVVNLDFLAILLNDTCVRLVQAEKNTHKRTLAGTILAKECVNLAPAKFKRDVIVSLDAREHLVDVQHLYNIVFVCHCLYLHVFIRFYGTFYFTIKLSEFPLKNSLFVLLLC